MLATRYQRPIACGAQTTGLLMGLTATHFSQDTAMVGLEFWFRFRRPIFADETIRLEWLVIAVRPNARLGGTSSTYAGASAIRSGRRR